MHYPPEIQRAIVEENLRRGLFWLGEAGEIAGFPVVPLTPRILFELHLACNGLLRADPVAPLALANFLWRLHPNFRRPDGSMPNRPTGRGSWLLAFFARRWTYVRVHRLARTRPWPLECACREYLAGCRQDEPAAAMESKATALPTPAPHVLDWWCHWWGSTYGVDPRTALDVPVALILQCRRTVAISHGETVIDPSTVQLSRWLFAQRRAALARN